MALDAQSAARGGSAIANGKGVHGALENPSSLMRMHRAQQGLHLHIGASADIQDDAGFIDTAVEEDTLAQDLENEIDALSARVITCTINDDPNATCLDDTQRMSELAARVSSILTRIDGKPIKATASADFGVGYTKARFPFAVHFKLSAPGSSTTDVAEGDKDYINTFATVLEDDRLTLSELIVNAPFEFSDDGQSVTVSQPEDVLQSDVNGGVLLRQQLGLSMAMSHQLAGFNIDLGVTPKFSKLSATNISTGISDRFNDDTDSLTKQLEDSEAVGNSFNLDIGASTSLQNLPLQLSVVARNMITEKITTKDNFVFETTPQLIVGGAFSFSAITLTADMALNEAKVDNLDTQIFAVGLDFSTKYYGLRAGISHDNARTADATALSLGFSVGPLHIGGRLTDRQSAQASAQLAYSF